MVTARNGEFRHTPDFERNFNKLGQLEDPEGGRRSHGFVWPFGPCPKTLPAVDDTALDGLGLDGEKPGGGGAISRRSHLSWPAQTGMQDAVADGNAEAAAEAAIDFQHRQGLRLGRDGGQ